jgi:phage anti-repressor protein
MSNHITLKDFLKKYTAISNKFIDEYYLFYEKTEDNKFGIKIQDVMKYLNIKNQDKFEERLRKIYILQKDYKIIRYLHKLEKGKKDANYLLSFEGFEKVCMASNTEKGKAFRDYFIMLRKFIDYYKDHFANKIIELAKDNKYIYILMVNKNKDLLKLGRADNIRNRLKSYATGKETHPDVKFIMIVDDAKKVEQCTKVFIKQFQYKPNTELYKMNIDDLKKTIFGCAEMDEITIKSMNDNKKYDTYIVYDDSKSIEYINLNGDVIGYEKGYNKIKKSKTKISKINKIKNKSRTKKTLK